MLLELVLRSVLQPLARITVDFYTGSSGLLIAQGLKQARLPSKPNILREYLPFHARMAFNAPSSNARTPRRTKPDRENGA